MSTLSTLSPDEIWQQVLDAALFGSLGLFLGTGFSRSLTSNRAPTFKSLLVRVCAELDLPFDFTDLNSMAGKSYPQIAEDIIARLAEQNEIGLTEASALLKNWVCRVCNLRPDPHLAERARASLKTINPQWVITTNYDLIAEELISNSVSLLPNQFLIPRTDRTPIYHLHGHVLEPSTIILTDSDYTGLSSPIEYRQLKLNLLLPESATIMLGYSLGDPNVKSALVWSKAFRSDYGIKPTSYQSIVVQALYTGTMTSSASRGRTGEIVIEVSDLLDFLDDLASRIGSARSAYAHACNEFDTGFARISSSRDRSVALSEMLGLINAAPLACDIPRVMGFVESILKPIWDSAREDYGWSHYATFLNTLVDIVIAVQKIDLHPLFFSYLASQLGLLSYYLNPTGEQKVGTAFKASRLWLTRKSEIDRQFMAKLHSFASANGPQEFLDLLAS